MKVGDLVANGQGRTGIVVGIGFCGRYSSYDKCPHSNPDVHVLSAARKCLWSYNALEVVSESR